MISNPSALRQRILLSRLCNTAGGNALDSASVQEPAHAEVMGVLHTGRVQLLGRDQRPTLPVPVHVQELLHQLRGPQVVHPVVLQQSPHGPGVHLALGEALLITCSARTELGVMLLRHGAEEAQLVAVLEEIILRADCAGRLAPGHRLAARETVAH